MRSSSTIVLRRTPSVDRTCLSTVKFTSSPIRTLTRFSRVATSFSRSRISSKRGVRRSFITNTCSIDELAEPSLRRLLHCFRTVGRDYDEPSDVATGPARTGSRRCPSEQIMKTANVSCAIRCPYEAKSGHTKRDLVRLAIRCLADDKPLSRSSHIFDDLACHNCDSSCHIL
jgi:hypothetical protein